MLPPQSPFIFPLAWLIEGVFARRFGDGAIGWAGPENRLRPPAATGKPAAAARRPRARLVTSLPGGPGNRRGAL